MWIGHAVNNKLLVSLSAIDFQQASATENTNKAIHQLLNYCATYPDKGIVYRSSNMVLVAHSDAGFANKTKTRSRAGAHLFLSENKSIPRWNGPVLAITQIMKYAVSSATEAEMTALFLTAKDMVPLQNTLTEMGRKQPPSPLQSDNSTAVGMTNSKYPDLKEIKIMGPAPQLDAMQGGTRSILNLLGYGSQQQW